MTAAIGLNDELNINIHRKETSMAKENIYFKLEIPIN